MEGTSHLQFESLDSPNTLKFIKLVSSDKQEFVVPLEVAKISPTLDRMLTGEFAEANSVISVKMPDRGSPSKQG